MPITERDKAHPAEKRRSQRVVAHLPALWIRRSGAIKSATADVSAQGIFPRTAEYAKKGELLKVEVSPPGESPIMLLVIVQHMSRKPGKLGFGLEIHSLESDDSRRWLNFYQRLQADSDMAVE